MISEATYAALAGRLEWPVSHVKALADVESSGVVFWQIEGEQRPAVRFEAHIFGARTGHRFDVSHPLLSCREWTPALAATTRAGAWQQLEEARALDLVAADESASWGAFQVMGFNWQRLRYAGIAEFVRAMFTEEGQLEGFARYIEADAALRASGRIGAWLDVERRYNGGGFNGRYARKIAAAVAHYEGRPVVPDLLGKGATGEPVRAIERALGRPQTGVFDNALEEAVRAFQAANGLSVDGLVGPFTRRVLGI